MQDNNALRIYDDLGNVLALIIKNEFDCSGIEFFTPDDYSQQVAYMHHDKDHVIAPHIHNTVRREIFYTKEVLFIKSGKLRCDFYSSDLEYIKSVIISTGDLILLVSGGHGFKCLEETSMIEVKQGPFAGQLDKTRFEEYKGDIKLVNSNE